MNLDLSASGTPSSDVPHEMLSCSVLPDGRMFFRVNFSSLSIMQECQRKVEYSLLRKLRSNLQSPALVFGSAIHKGLEVYYCGERTERALPPDYAETMNMIGCGQWQPEWESNLLLRAARSFVLKAAPLAALADDNKRSITTGVWMLTHYFQKYLTDEYVIVRDATGPIVERKFQLRIFEDARIVIDLFGTIDFVMKNEVTGQVLGGDHKTTSSLRDFYGMCNPNHQYSGYAMAINRVLGYETDSFLINALEVKAPPKTSRGSPPNFARQITTRTEEHYNELIDAVVLSCLTFRANLEASTWPMATPGPCTGKYGPCTYLDVCAAPKALRENIISARFVATGG